MKSRFIHSLEISFFSQFTHLRNKPLYTTFLIVPPVLFLHTRLHTYINPTIITMSQTAATNQQPTTEPTQQQQQKPTEQTQPQKREEKGLGHFLIQYAVKELNLPPSNDFPKVFGQVKDLLTFVGMWPHQIEMVSLTPTTVRIKDEVKTLMSSYSYLSLGMNQAIIEAGEAAGRKYSNLPGTRVMCGTSEIHTQLEQKVAKFFGREDAVVFSSTYMANISSLCALIQKDDIIVADQFIHQSLRDGCTLSGAKFERFRHADLKHAEDIFERIRNKENFTGNVFLIVDSVYSMDGDILDLPTARALCDKYNVVLFVDECHALGVIGKTGRGVEEHFNMPGACDLITSCFSKSLGCTGGFVTGHKKYINVIRYMGRAPMFSVPLCAYNCGQAMKALEILENNPQLVEKLQQNADYFKSELKKRGFDTGLSQTAIVPLIVGYEKKVMLLFKHLFENGFFACVVHSPAVPMNKSRLRLIMTVEHTKEDIDRFIKCLEEFEAMYSMMEKHFNKNVIRQKEEESTEDDF